MQFDIVWQLAGLGIVVIVVHSVFKTAGREELAWLTSLAGLGLFMILVLQIVGRLFQAVRTTFGM
ncbi:MAG: stage III sporulation protein AC [Firmicutes bacterium]|nr:stage III sporulation protein AC [Bacillota bacterium]